jgi:hypothetical protein
MYLHRDTLGTVDAPTLSVDGNRLEEEGQPLAQPWLTRARLRPSQQRPSGTLALGMEDTMVKISISVEGALASSIGHAGNV